MKRQSDEEFIIAIKQNDEVQTARFYKCCRDYFLNTFWGILELRTSAMEPKDLFQETFVVLWTEIVTGKIYVCNHQVIRCDKDGVPRRMSASLTTYLMSIAKYKHLEWLRDEEAYADAEPTEDVSDHVDDEPEVTMDGIIQQSVNNLPPRCREILTMFYYEKKSLDEILQLRKENNTKEGLKSGKSKCMLQLKERVKAECSKYHLKVVHDKALTTDNEWTQIITDALEERHYKLRKMELWEVLIDDEFPTNKLELPTASASEDSGTRILCSKSLSSVQPRNATIFCNESFVYNDEDANVGGMLYDDSSLLDNPAAEIAPIDEEISQGRYDEALLLQIELLESKYVGKIRDSLFGPDMENEPAEDTLYKLVWRKINVLHALHRDEDALAIVTYYRYQRGVYQQDAIILWDELHRK